jgi:hypothetical protein
MAKSNNLFRWFDSSPEMIRLAVMRPSTRDRRRPADVRDRHQMKGRAMARFRRMKTLQKFSSVHASVHNHFSQERLLVSRQEYRERRSAAPAQWRSVMN